ncbi:hypothetical protein Q2K19_22070 [Micromonospora soli]|uniref:hypothetical protein n=1 Tax=Micromonospora sp. NBRC 110009 TaxID=3061627 RepID=UPI002673DCCB|nr:hypothetical protein [Micromonospora sp. NBRC 110009]WKT96863.1 hypothetical protein Q2K19_22070 [Micromonospora sp. NBRC 110009]
MDPPHRGVCVVTVERQLDAPCLIFVSVKLDVLRPEESRQAAKTQRAVLAEVRRFLRDMAVPE